MRSQMFFLSLSSLLVAGAGYYFSYAYECGYSIACYNLYSYLGHPLLYGMPALALVFALLAWVPNAVRPWWKYFGIWFLPIAILFFALYRDPASGDLFSPYPEQIYPWFDAFYISISVAIILFVRFAKRKSA